MGQVQIRGAGGSGGGGAAAVAGGRRLLRRRFRLKRETVLTYSPLFITWDGLPATVGRPAFYLYLKLVSSALLCFI